MNRPDARPAGPIRAGHASGGLFWRPVLLWALVAAVLSAAAVWWLLPRTADSFSSVEQALRAGVTGTTRSPAGLPVYVYSGSANPSPGGGVTSPNSAGPDPAAPTSAAAEAAGSAPLPLGVIASDVAAARDYSPEVAVDFAGSGWFAVAPVQQGGSPSAVPMLLAAAVVTALAVVVGSLVSRNRTRRSLPPPADTAARSRTPEVMPPGTEPVASPELRRLRRRAVQRETLARSVAELLSSMPEAVAWQAEKALAEAGVQRVVPDGEPFDAALHHAVGTEPAAGGGHENTVARTVRPGYADDDSILVYPKVVIYTRGAGGAER